MIQARVARCLLRSSSGGRRNTRQEVADLTQDTFRILFDRDSATLASWSPDAGLSLDNFVGLVAHRHALSVLRSKRRNPYTDEATEELDHRVGAAASPEAIVSTQRMMQVMLDELESELSPKGLHLFRRLFLDEATVGEVTSELGMSSDAVYAWKSRLGKRLREKVKRLLSESEPSPRRPGPGETP